MAILSSVLEEVIKQMGNQSFKKESVINALKNRGVKDIELKQSGVTEFIANHEGPKINAAELQSVLEKRTDKLESAALGRKPFNNIRETEFIANEEALLRTFNITRNRNDILTELEDLKFAPTKSKDKLRFYLAMNDENLQTSPHHMSKAVDTIIEYYNKLDTQKTEGDYGVNILTKQLEHGVENHFDVPNYYAHVRYTDVPGDARYVHELQSDVHGAGEKRVRGDNIIEQEDTDLEYALIDAILLKHNSNIMQSLANHPDAEMLIEDIGSQLIDLLNTPNFVTGHNGITRIAGTLNVSKDVAEQMQQDIIDGANKLKEVRSRYAPTLFTDKEPNYLHSTINKTLVDAANEGQSTVKFRIAPDKNLMRSAGIQQWYEKDVANTLEQTAKKIGAGFEKTEDGYAKLTLPKEFKLPLYSATGIAVLTASEQNKALASELPNKVQQAKDAGLDENQIKNYMLDKYDNNIVGNIFAPKRTFNDVLTDLK